MAAVAGLLLAFAAPADAVTRVQAERAALRALKARDGSKPLIVFRLRAPLRRGTVITEGGTSRPAAARRRPGRFRRQRVRNAAGVAVVRLPVVARVRGERAWFFYEDQGPYQSYQHPGRVVLVGERTGRVKVSRTLQWAPLVNGRLPVFLALNPAYLDARYRAFAREWSVPRGLRQPVLARASAADPAALRKAHDMLVAEGSCFVRISDTIGVLYDFGPVESAEVGLSGFFVRLGLRNAPGTYRYSIFSGTTPTGYVQRQAIRRDGCRDVFLYIAGGGFRSGPDAVNVGNRSLPGGVSEQQNLTAADLRRLIARNPSVTFKLKVDAPYSGDLLAGLRGLPNLLIFEASAPGDKASFEYLPPLGGAGEAANVRRRLAFTARQLVGLERFLADPREVDHAAAAVALGRTRSFMAWMLARGFALGGEDDVADDLGVPPQIQTFGFTPDGPSAPENRAPSALAQSVSTTEDTARAITLAGSDPDGDPLNFTVTGGPSHGSLSGSGATRTYTPDADYSGPDSFTFTASDGRGGTSAPQTVTISVSAVNDAPTVTTSSGSLSYTEGDPAADVDPGLTVDDVDDSQFEGATVRVTGFQSGDRLDFTDQLGIAGTYDLSTGVLTLTGTASEGDYQTALRSIGFRHTGDNPATSKSVEFRLNDGDDDSAPASRGISITGVNDSPSLDTTDTALAYTENAGAVAVDNGIAVTDPDSVQLTGATVQVTSNFLSAQDDLVFSDQNGITGSYNDATGTLTLTGTASVADYRNALRSVRYQNTSDDPSGATRTVSFRVDDDSGAVSNVATRDVVVSPVNDAPVVNTSGGSTSYTEGAAGTAVDGALTVSDVDDTNLDGASVRVSGNFEPGDILDFVNQNGITGNYDSGTGVLTLDGTASEGDYQTALRSIAYRNTTDDNLASPKTVEFTVDDGPAISAPATKNVAITPVNDAPTLNTTGSTLAYSEGDGTQPVDDGITLTDPDSTLMAGATVQITSNFTSAEDDLVFLHQNGITGSYNDTTGTLTLTGTSSAANYQAALRSVSYQNTSDDPSTATRTVSFRVDDASGAASNVATRDVSVAKTNDAPVVTTSAGATSYTEGGGATAVDNALTVTDVDDANIESAQVRVSQNFESGDVLAFTDTANITGGYDSGTGILTLSGTDTAANYQAALRTVTFDHTGDNPQTGKVVEFEVNDGSADSNAATKSINLTGVNDGPTITTTGSTHAYDEDDGAAAVDGGVTLDDPENNQISGATVQITSNFTSAEDELAFADTADITGSYDDTTGTLTLSGNASEAAYQSALRAVTYENSSQNPSSATRTVSFQATDAGTPNEASNVATRDVSVTPVNDASVVDTTDTALAWTEDDPPAAVDPGVTVSDVDDTNLESAQVRVSSNFQSGDVLSFVNTANITGSYDSGTGVLTLSGTDTVANYQAALRSVAFDHTGAGPSPQKTVEFKVNDGGLDSAAATRNIDIASSNDGPIVTSGGTLSYTENDPATAVHSALTVTDAEGDAVTNASASITTGFQSGEDALSWTDNDVADNISLDVGNSTNQTIALTGNDSAANYQAALRAVKYENNSQSPSSTNRTVTFSATDVNAATGNDTRTISVTSVDDLPVAVDDSATRDEDSGATAVDVMANDTDLDGGPKTISSASDPANGTVVLTGGSPSAHTGLTYQPNSNYCNAPPGTTPDTFTYTLNGGSTATVSMTVTCVNDAPVADDETFDAAKTAHGNTTLIVDDSSDGAPTVTHPNKSVSGDILSGDTDVDGPGPLTVVAETVSTDDGGSATIESDGDFTYHPPATTSCTQPDDFFDYTIKDGGSPEESGTGRVTIALDGCVWYVRNNAAAGGDGTSRQPFDTLAEAETASGSDHTVFVFDGDNTSTNLHTGFAMNSGERLIGEHEGLSVDPDQAGPLGTDTLHPANPAAHPTLTASGEDVVALDDGNEVRGFNIDPQGAGGGIAGESGDTGGTIDDVNIVDAGTLGTEPGLDLSGTSGTFNLSNLTVSTNGATGVRLNGAGTAAFAPTGTISIASAGAKGLEALSTNMGTSQFDAITVTGSPDGAVSMVNTGGTTTFGDGDGTDLALTTTSGSAAAFALSAAGTVTVGEGGTDDVSATGGPAVDVTSTSGATLDFDTVSSTNSATDGINLGGLGAGTFSADGGSISGATGISFDLDGGSGDVTYPGGLLDGAGQAAEITSRSGTGTVTLSGQVGDDNDAGGGIRVSSNTGGSTVFGNAAKTINTTTSGSPAQNNAIVMSASDGHTLALSGGGLDVDTGTGNGVDADNSGTLVVSGSGNTIDTGTGRALHLNNTDIGAGGLTFQRVSSNGAVNGISLTNTGSAGGLTIQGTGVANSGGQIQNSTGDGISMSGVGGGVSLASMNVSSNGNALTEHGFDLADVTGTVTFDQVTASANAEDNVHLVNNAGTLNLTVNGGSYSNTANNASTGNDGIYLEGTGTGSMTAAIQNVTLNNNRGDHVQLNTDNSTSVTQNLTVHNGNLDANPATSNGGGIVVTPGSTANVTATLTNNDIQGADSSAIVVDNVGGGSTVTSPTVRATVTGNTIGSAGVANSGAAGGDGMQFVSNSSANLRVLATSNTIHQVANLAGIRVLQGDGGGRLDATLRGNTVGPTSSALGGAYGIYVQSGSISGDAGRVCLDTGSPDNSIAGSGSGGLEDLYVEQRFSTKIELPGLVGTTDAQAQTFLIDRNNGNGTPTAFVDSSPEDSGWQSVAACQLP